MFEVIVEDSSLAGTALDFGNLFNFSNFDPCYDPMSSSATAATDGGPIGAATFCTENSTSVFPYQLIDAGLIARPNPMNFSTILDYNLKSGGNVRLSVHDALGQEIAVLVNGVQPAGQQIINFNPAQRLPLGIYFVRLQTEEGQMSLKLMIN